MIFHVKINRDFPFNQQVDWPDENVDGFITIGSGDPILQETKKSSEENPNWDIPSENVFLTNTDPTDTYVKWEER